MRLIVIIISYTCCLNFAVYSQTIISLKHAIELTLKNNPFYMAEKLNGDLAKAEIINAGMKQNPVANVSYLQVPSSRHFSENTNFFSSENREASVEFSKSFQVKGQRKLKIEKAEKSYSVSQSALKEYERNMVLETAEEWLNVWYSINKMNLVKAAKINSDTLLSVNHIRLKNQVITNTEFLRTQIIDDQYSLLLKNSEQEYLREIQNLKLLIGVEYTVSVSEKDSVFLTLIPESSDSLLRYALQNRTDIVMLEKSVDAAKTDIRLQHANSFPQPELGLNYSAHEHIPYIGSYLSLPIPVFNRNQGEIAKSKILLDQSERLLDATNLKVKTEIINTWDEYSTNKSNYEKYREIYHKSENVLRVVKMTYLKGGTTILDYLEAERNWFELQNKFYEAFYNYQKSYLELLYVSSFIQNI
jgi:outer membrane protein, heavy metal efflux system